MIEREQTVKRNKAKISFGAAIGRGKESLYKGSCPHGPVQFYVLPYPTQFLLCLTDKGGGYGKMQNWTGPCGPVIHVIHLK